MTEEFSSVHILIILSIVINFLTTVSLTFLKLVRRSKCCGGDLIMRSNSDMAPIEIETPKADKVEAINNVVNQ